MNQTINPVNITGAALITQISLITIMFLGALILKLKSTASYIPHQFAWIILSFMLIGTGCLLFSDEFSTIWKPLFGDADLPVIKWSTALLIMFLTNIICVSILVSNTGGSRDSAFSPIYFILPALAIFLRESMGRIILYSVLVSIVFTWNLFRLSSMFVWSTYTPQQDEENRNISIAYWMVSIACLILATFIGYITRPQ